MSHLNWLNKLQPMLDDVGHAAASYWEIGAIVSMVGAICALVVAMKNPSRNEAMRTRARIFRYCHNCPYSDLFTETCTINADAGEKCGLIDSTANIHFKVLKGD